MLVIQQYCQFEASPLLLHAKRLLNGMGMKQAGSPSERSSTHLRSHTGPMHDTFVSSQDVTFLSLFFGSMPYTALRNADVGSLACSRCAGRSLSPPGNLCTIQHAHQPITLSICSLALGLPSLSLHGVEGAVPSTQPVCQPAGSTPQPVIHSLA